MAYTTIAAVTGSAWSVSGEVSASIIQEAINISDSIIDSYLDRRYSVPFPSASVPQLVESFSISMARYWGQARAGNFSEIPQRDIDTYNHIIHILEEIRDGKQDIPGVAEKSADDNLWSNTMDYTPIHDVDDEKYHLVDEDRLDDIDDARD